MAWEIGDSFDFYRTSFNAADLTTPGTCWATALGGNGDYGTGSNTRFGVGNYYNIGSNGDGTLISNVFGNDTTIYVNFAYNYNAALSVGNTAVEFGFSLCDGTTKQVGVWFRAQGDVIITSGAYNGTILGTWTPAFNGQVWNHYQIKIVIDPTVGSVEVRKNGNTSDDYSLTGINTRNGTANSYANHINFGCFTSGQNLDDFYLFSGTGAAPATWQGDVRAVELMPNSDNSVQWTRSTGSTNNSCVNEVTQNADTNYVSTNTASNLDLYGIAALATTPNAIINVVLKSFARMDDAGPHTYKHRLSSGGTTSDGSNVAMTTSYQWSWTNYLTDPHTSAAWTFAGVNAALIGPFDVA